MLSYFELPAVHTRTAAVTSLYEHLGGDQQADANATEVVEPEEPIDGEAVDSVEEDTSESEPKDPAEQEEANSEKDA